ncbi:Ig-like domain repeat protein [Methanobrevibacter sp.]|uniref:Ig-like domain repeat protein n=1 Tax=Methanobrevibacter sp. TaxID=66852 RepID=UPI00388F7324
MKRKSLLLITILLTVLCGLSTVSANENVSDVNTILGDSDSSSTVNNWNDLMSNCSDTNANHIINLNGTLNATEQIQIRNNVTVIGNENSFIVGNYGNLIPFICTDALNVTFRNVNFQNLSGDYLMQFSGNGNYVIENCDFSNIDVGSKSVIYSNYGVVNITNCSFTDCNVRNGVINNYYAANSATVNNARLYVTDSRFRNNHASYHSGAIANGGYLVVENSMFDSNYAVNWAGAIHTAAYANTTIHNSTFIDNIAYWNGGALYTYSNLQIYNSTFIGNNCTTNNGGGAIGACKMNTVPNIFVIGSRFENNINTCYQLGGDSTTGVGRGGAISIMDDGTLKVYNNNFTGNDAVIGSAISAISQVSWGSPDVEIVGNNFINHTGDLGSDVLVVSLLNSNYLVENNTYINDKISLAKFRLDIDENNNGNVTVNITLRLKHPEYYDFDIITKSGFMVYIDDTADNFTVNTYSFTYQFNDTLNHTIKVVPLFLYNEYRDYSAFDTIYVSTTGNDNNNGADRNSAVRTIKKALELANGAKYIKILEGTYYERSLTISEDLIIEGEGNVILVGNSSDVTTFTVNSPSVGFSNLKFTGITGGRAIGTEDDFIVTINDCSFYSNNVGNKLIEVYGLNIKDSTFDNNVVNFVIYTSNVLNMENCNVSNNRLMSTSTSNSIVNIAKGIISNSTFTNNNGRRGILRINGNTVSIYESKFINNTASNYGGAIYASSADNINIISSIFYNNTANTRGGAIYTDNSVSNLNITYSILIGNNCNNNRNYQIDRASTNTNIFAINNWWGNTDEDPFTAPTFYSDVNVNASIWLVLVSTSDSVLYNPNESTVVTFDLTYTNKVGSDAPPGSNETGNITHFRIDGIYLPVLEGVLSTIRGNVNVTNVSLVDGKATVLFTATGYRSGLIMDVLGISCRRLWIIPFPWENDLNHISDDSINLGEISSQKSYSDDLLGYGLPPEEWEEVCEFMQECTIILYNNCAILHPFLEDMFYENWMDDDDLHDFESNGIPDKYFKEDNFHVNLSIFNSSTQKWDNVVEDSYCLPFPNTILLGSSYYNNVSIFNFTKGLYKISMVYDGQDIEYEYYDDGEDDYVTGVYTYEPRSWEAELNLTSNFLNPSINNLNSVISYENNYIKINPKIVCKYDNWRHPVQYEEEQDDDYGSINTFALLYNNKNYDFNGETTFLWGGNVKINDSAYNPDDFPEVKPANITMTITQGDKVIKEFSVAPDDTYSFNDLPEGEYNLTAVYNDSYYGYAEKTVTITVYKNIWDNVGADEGYSHQTEYFGSKNVEPLWNLSVNANNFNLEDKYQSSVIDSNGNIYVVNGTKILVINSDGNLIKTLTITSDDHTGIFSTGLALYNNYLICSVYTSTMLGASVWDINNNYANSWFPWGGYGEAADKNSTTSMYAPVVSNGKVYISSWQYYSDNDHIYEWTTNTHSNPFPRSTGAPSVDSAGYIYVNTKSGLYILDPELNIMDLSFGDAGKYGRPVIDSADMVYVFNADRTVVYALNRETGIEWNKTIAGGACGAMAVDVENKALYIVGNDGILYKLNRATGDMSEFYTLGTTSSSILVDGRGTVYVGGDDGIMYAVTNEGKTLFKYDVGSPISKDLVLDNNGTLYVYANFTVYALTGAPRLYSEIIINVSDVSAKRNNTIVATLPENATGNVTFIIDDTIESGEIPIISGNATWIAPGLLSGNHTVKASWAGDTEYFGCDATEEFNVYKVNSTIDLEDSVNYVGKLTQLNITLPEDAVGNVTVTFNRKTETVKIVNGTATFETTPLEAGNYTIDFSWDGDERYFGNSSYAYFTVIKNDAALTIDADSIREGEDLKVTVTLSDDESGIVLIMVGDVKDFAEIKGGKAEFAISGLTADTYDINAIYLGDNKYYNTTETSQVTVSAKDTTTIEISPEVITEDDNQSIEVTLPDDATGNVLVEVNGNTFYAEVNGGKVNVPVSGLKANTTYPVTVTYSGNDIYSETTEEGEVTTPEEPVVEPLDPGLELSVQDTVITVSVNDNATGLVIITVGDISFVMDAHELGPIDVSDYLTNGTYDVEVIYLGDEVFMNATDSDKVTVPEEPIIRPLDPELYVDIQNTTITVSINENATGLVIITVGDISFVFDASELEPVDVSEFLTNGTYPVSVEYLGDDVFDEALFIGGNVTVPEEPVVEPKDAGLKVDIKDTTIAVSINKDATGLVIITVGDISFVFDASELEPVDVSEYLANGTYPVSVEYLGDDVFDEALFIGGNVTVPEEPVVEPKDAGLNVDIKDTIIAVSINKDATGLVIITVGDISFVFDASELEPVDVSEYLTNGTYPVSVEYLGDDIFANATQSGSVTVPEEPVVEPKDPELKATAKETAISVSVNKDATGYVVVDVDGTSYYAEIENGQAVIDVKGLEAGENYTASVTYMGDGNFSEAETTVKISIPDEPVVEPKDPNLKASVENTTVSVSVDKDATGYVVVDVDGTSYYAEVENGQAVISIPALRPGSYSADVTYAGDENYKNASTTVSIVVPDEPVVEPKDPNLKATAVNNTITATVDKDATGSIMVDVDGQGYYAPIKDGKAVINVIGLDDGKYDAVVSYVGDDTFKAANATVSITVPKKEDPQPEPVDPKADIKVSNDSVSIELPKDATGYLLVDVDGQGYYVPVKDGKATLDLPELAPGNHTVTVTYTGDKKYDSANATQTITVEEDIHTVIAENLTKVEKAPDRFEAIFTDAKGNPLANTDVTFELNGQKYTRTTDANGKAGMNINLIAGNYTVVTTNPVTKESVTNTITVLPRLEGSDLTKYFRNASQYRVKVYDDNGNPAKAGEIVTFNINGVLYNRTTRDDGFVQLSINLNAGDYIITSEYKGCRISNNIKVLPILTGKDLTKKYGQAGAFEATLVDGQGKPYANQQVEFNINGVFYKRPTNSDGIAKLNINLMPGEYIITSSFNGFSTANTVTVTA